MTAQRGVLQAARAAGSLCAAAVMRHQQDVAVQRLLGQHVVQARRGQVAGQEDAVPAALDQQDEAVGVVAAEDALPRRMDHFQRAAAAGGEPLARPDFAQRDAAAADGVVQGRIAGLCFSNICGVT